MNKQRRHFTPQEKVAVLKRHLLEKAPVSDLCDELGILPTLFYRWQKEFFEKGANALQGPRDNRSARLERQVAELEQKLTKKHEVLSELMEEHIALKKRLGAI